MNNFHDANILGIRFNPKEKIAQLELRSTDNISFKIEFHEVRAIRSDDFVGQNVISRFLRSDEYLFDHVDLVYLLNWITSTSNNDSWLNEKTRNEWLENIIQKTLIIALFEPSVGTQVIILCERINSIRM